MLDRRTAPPKFTFKPLGLKRADKIQLSNGVAVHLLQAGSQPILRIELIFKAGTWFETQSGVSYLSSKMLPEGTSRLTAKQIAEKIALYGAFMEIHHGFEHVNFTLYLMEKHLENLLPILGEIVGDAQYPQQELDNLKTITNQSLKVNKEKTQFVASTEFRKALFGPVHPYGKQYWEDDVHNVQREEIVNFAKKHYHNGNLEIFVSGNFNQQKIVAAAERYFGFPITVPSPDFVQHESQPDLKNQLVIVEKEDALQSSIRVGSISITRSHKDFIPLLVANELLGGFFGSRLMKNIREDKGFTYGIHSGVHTLVHGSYFAISTDVKKENTRQTLEEISKEMQALVEVRVGEEELDTVKSYMLGRFMNSINTPFALMDKYKNLYFNGLDYGYYETYVEKVQKIGSNDIRHMAETYFKIKDQKQIVVGGI